MTHNEIKGCPFCGEQLVVHSIINENKIFYHCPKGHTRPLLMEEWQTRHPANGVTEFMGYNIDQLIKAIYWCEQHGFDIKNDPKKLKKPWCVSKPTPELPSVEEIEKVIYESCKGIMKSKSTGQEWTLWLHKDEVSFMATAILNYLEVRKCAY